MEEIDTSVKKKIKEEKLTFMHLSDNLISIIFSFAINFNQLILFRGINKKTKRILENLIFQNVKLFI
jgi:hypothetical protein